MKIEREGALLMPAIAAGIKVPPDTFNYSAEEYAHWNLYRGIQLNRECKEGDEWHNAVVISKLSDYEARNATWATLDKYGFRGRR